MSRNGLDFLGIRVSVQDKFEEKLKKYINVQENFEEIEENPGSPAK